MWACCFHRCVGPLCARVISPGPGTPAIQRVPISSSAWHLPFRALKLRYLVARIPTKLLHRILYPTNPSLSPLYSLDSTMAQVVYRERLSERRHGIPMWIPEPSPDEADIGDVGYIDSSGAWKRFFNILHCSEKDSVGQRLPPGFKSLSEHRRTMYTSGEPRPEVTSELRNVEWIAAGMDKE